MTQTADVFILNARAAGGMSATARDLALTGLSAAISGRVAVQMRGRMDMD
ncbi:hypothetical protein [Pararhizobium sp. LjRoot238]